MEGQIVCNFNDPEGFPVTEFRFDLWRQSLGNVLVHAPVNILDLLFITYMHDFWVQPQCCQNKQYRVKIPHKQDFFTEMIRQRDKVATYRKLFQCLIGKPVMFIALRNDIVMCWDFDSSHEPVRISGKCLLCDIGFNENCDVCHPHFMCALEIVHRPEIWKCIWPNLFVSFPIELGGSPARGKIVFTCNLKNRKFTCREEGDTHPSHFLPMGLSHLLRQCPHIEKVPCLTTMLIVYLRKKTVLGRRVLPVPLQKMCQEWVEWL